MKQFECPSCGSKVFTIVYRHYTVADFSQEGAVEGHPHIHSGGERFDSMFCDNCGEPIEGTIVDEILEEVI